ncbi:hypothetical protein H4R18_002573 [Coemansia javaensis]|uniref:Cytosol aminopeptidase domain-containing protein n=1 Tax=Coemansia javaensis TaxID=2761396 RepID=A0A9W8LIJ3_9FUNG|nr:hypothetical protein H4R18_002573 [Coemansia javaensis]
MQALARARGLIAAGARGFGSSSALRQQQQQQLARAGLVVGMFSSQKLAAADAAGLSDAQQRAVVARAQALGFAGKAGQVQTVLSDDLAQQIALVGLGAEDAADAAGTTVSEIVRTAVANGVRQLRAAKVESIAIAPVPHLQAAAEGAALALHAFDAFKSAHGRADADAPDAAERAPPAEAQLLGPGSDAWATGRVYAAAQNLARELTATPANHMTPTEFARRAEAELAGLAGVQVRVHDRAWAEAQRMGGLLTVARGSDEPLRFVEIVYRGRAEPGPAADADLALVGKGITFDTGGYNLKPGRHMDLMKGDMGGGAAVVAATRAIAQLRLPLNVATVVPLCENMISGRAAKVSDVYTSRAGLTVEIMNTDAEGRLVLADALHYVIEAHRPRAVVDVATLTGAMMAALGERYTGVFTPSPSLWAAVAAAGHATDEPVWRMPLHDVWDAMLKSQVADLSNIGCRAEAGACTAAAFLRQFVHGPRLAPPAVPRDQNCDDDARPRWAHMDIAGPMEAAAEAGYHRKGMSGRPTRLLIELARGLAGGNE